MNVLTKNQLPEVFRQVKAYIDTHAPSSGAGGRLWDIAPDDSTQIEFIESAPDNTLTYPLTAAVKTALAEAKAGDALGLGFIFGGDPAYLMVPISTAIIDSEGGQMVEIHAFSTAAVGDNKDIFLKVTMKDDTVTITVSGEYHTKVNAQIDGWNELFIPDYGRGEGWNIDPSVTYDNISVGKTVLISKTASYFYADTNDVQCLILAKGQMMEKKYAIGAVAMMAQIPSEGSSYAGPGFIYIDFENNGQITFYPAPIGEEYYTAKNDTAGILLRLQIAEDWDSSITSLDYKYSSRLDIIDFPKVDVRAVTTARGLFRGCLNLKRVPSLDWKSCTKFDSMYANTGITLVSNLSFPNADSNTYGMFNECKNLKFIRDINLGYVVNADYMFANCTSLTEVSSLTSPGSVYGDTWSANGLFSGCISLQDISASVDLVRLKSCDYIFKGCIKLKRIYCTINMSLCGSCKEMISGCSSLVNMTLENLGAGRANTTIDLSGAPLWGDGSDENRQSLVDSLLTYSYNRNAAVIDTATIKLSPTTLARLTTDEVAAITAKGYTLAAV